MAAKHPKSPGESTPEPEAQPAQAESNVGAVSATAEVEPPKPPLGLLPRPGQRPPWLFSPSEQEE
jgi:hypothetical protein